MVNFYGKEYYIDFEQITKKCEVKKTLDNTSSEILEINVFKYELIKMCLQRILEDGYEDNEDNDISSFNMGDKSLSFKIALNTLIKNEILLEYDNEE